SDTFRENRIHLAWEYTSRDDTVMPDRVAKHLARVEEVENSLSYSLYRTPEVGGDDAPNWALVFGAGMWALITLIAAGAAYWIARRYWPPAEAAPAETVPDEADPGESTPAGIRGWLILIAIGLVASLGGIAFMLWEARYVFSASTWSLLTTPGQAAYHAMWAPALLFEILGYTALFGFVLVLMLLFFQKRRALPAFYIAYLVANFLFAGVEAVLTHSLPLEEAGSPVGPVIGTFMALLIWIPYFRVSRRVKATFVR
ncbi:MAG: DUF2569 domain-containing protein, partial [Gemmatimonadetes bacterium]|nr:DUF2569 domain-containing protein [Gemmatimonadota bacterium]